MVKFVHIKENKRVLIEFIILIFVFKSTVALAGILNSNDEIAGYIKQIFQNRNCAILRGDGELIKPYYDTNTKFGLWAYQHEIKKMKYIHNWEEKQGIEFIDIIPTVVIKSIKIVGETANVTLLCSTEYKYIYKDTPNKINSCRIGTHHVLRLLNEDDTWIIAKEWYKDPFEDSLDLNRLKVEDIKKLILSQNQKEPINSNSKRLKVVEYINQFCGAASEEKYGYKYNKKYRNYNSMGGDCANFASQAIFEGGKFKRNSIWNFDKIGSTKAWVNAEGFKSYMVNSGRSSIIAYGNYEKVHNASYKLLPGDFVAYQKNGKITHISVVSGDDSRGYALVSCHNTDRNNVPWDLGWSDKNIKFWLIRVHY